MDESVDTDALRKVGNYAPWIVRQNGEGPLVTAAADEIDRLRTEAATGPSKDDIYHAVTWAVRDAGGAATELQVTEALDRLYGEMALPCTCGFGGEHHPANPRCERNGWTWKS